MSTELGGLAPMRGTANACLVFRRLYRHGTDITLPPLEIAFHSHWELMSTPFQGASGPSGQAGLRPAFGQPAVSRNHTAPEPVLTELQQMSPEQSISYQLRRLVVRLLTDIFDVRANDMPGVQEICRNVTVTAHRGTILPF